MFTSSTDLAHLADAYLALKVRELTHWHDDARDGEWRSECAAQLALFRAELQRRGIA
jgi:hypothetical protein